VQEVFGMTVVALNDLAKAIAADDSLPGEAAPRVRTVWPDLKRIAGRGQGKP